MDIVFVLITTYFNLCTYTVAPLCTVRWYSRRQLKSPRYLKSLYSISVLQIRFLKICYRQTVSYTAYLIPVKKKPRDSNKKTISSINKKFLNSASGIVGRKNNQFLEPKQFQPHNTNTIILENCSVYSTNCCRVFNTGVLSGNLHTTIITSDQAM
jgi:hypothetical protein